MTTKTPKLGEVWMCEINERHKLVKVQPRTIVDHVLSKPEITPLYQLVKVNDVSDQLTIGDEIMVGVHGQSFTRVKLVDIGETGITVKVAGVVSHVNHGNYEVGKTELEVPWDIIGCEYKYALLEGDHIHLSDHPFGEDHPGRLHALLPVHPLSIDTTGIPDGTSALRGDQ